MTNEIFYKRIETREGYAYEPVELVIMSDAKPFGCKCYAYRTHDEVLHLIQCDQCGSSELIVEKAKLGDRNYSSGHTVYSDGSCNMDCC